MATTAIKGTPSLRYCPGKPHNQVQIENHSDRTIWVIVADNPNKMQIKDISFHLSTSGAGVAIDRTRMQVFSQYQSIGKDTKSKFNIEGGYAAVWVSDEKDMEGLIYTGLRLNRGQSKPVQTRKFAERDENSMWASDHD